jgi:general secretion pathway protein B
LREVERFEERLRQEQKMESVEEEEAAPEATDGSEEPPPEPIGGASNPDEEAPNPAPEMEPETEAPPEAAPQAPTSPVSRPVGPSAGLEQTVSDLRLTVHVYSAVPEQRFVIINSRKMREGERSRKGLLVEEITPDGVQLEYQGQRFFQPR